MAIDGEWINEVWRDRREVRSLAMKLMALTLIAYGWMNLWTMLWGWLL